MLGRKFFYFLINGKFAERVVPGEVIHTTHSIQGRLLNVTFNSSPSGKIMKIHIANEENFYMVSMYLSSRPAYAFLMLIGGLDLKKDLTLVVEKSNGRDNIKAYQEEKLVPWTIDVPGFAELVIQEKVTRLLERLRKDILSSIEANGNPFPFHQFYKPPKLSKSERLGIKYPVYAKR